MASMVGSLFGSLFCKPQEMPKTDINTSLMRDLGAVINSMSMPSVGGVAEGNQLGQSIADYIKFINDSSAYKRQENYKLYEKIDDTDSLVSSVLNIYSDEITMGTHEGDVTKTFTIASDNVGIKEFLEKITKQLNLKSRIKCMARDLVKYGDVFDEIVFTENHLPSRLVNLPPETMFVNVNRYGEFADRNAKAYIQQLDGLRSDEIAFPWWKVAHTKWEISTRDIYGTSLLRPIRKLYHQLRAVLDGVVIERVLRAPQRLKYVIDTGSMPADKAVEVANKFKETNRRRRVMDSSGVFKIENTPMSPEEDIYIASGPEGKGDVSVIEGSNQTRNVDDLNFLINMYISAMGVPKAYLAFEGESHNRNVITQLDIHHARLVRAYQGELIRALQFIYDTCLSAIGIPPETVSYRIVFPFIRTEDDLRKWQILNLKIRVGFMLRTQVGVRITDEWIMKYLLDIPEDELEYIGYDPNNTDPPMAYGGGAASTPGTSLPGEAVEYLKKSIADGKDKELNTMLMNLAELIDSKAKHDTNGKYTVPMFRNGTDQSKSIIRLNTDRINEFVGE